MKSARPTPARRHFSGLQTGPHCTSLKHLLTFLDRINAQGAQFRSLTETIDTSTAAGRMMMQIVGAFAEFELEMIRERTRVGLHAAMRRGSKPGGSRAMAGQCDIFPEPTC
ncbi:recombinase family protein [Polaromonas aquatica]|uniref:recombinase family protein n=1 Tax=Polaromonas aquatica TaxID=332657 RepID=UPI003D654899